MGDTFLRAAGMMRAQNTETDEKEYVAEFC